LTYLLFSLSQRMANRVVINGCWLSGQIRLNRLEKGKVICLAKKTLCPNYHCT